MSWLHLVPAPNSRGAIGTFWNWISENVKKRIWLSVVLAPSLNVRRTVLAIQAVRKETPQFQVRSQSRVMVPFRWEAHDATCTCRNRLYEQVRPLAKWTDGHQRTVNPASAGIEPPVVILPNKFWLPNECLTQKRVTCLSFNNVTDKYKIVVLYSATGSTSMPSPGWWPDFRFCLVYLTSTGWSRSKLTSNDQELERKYHFFVERAGF